MTMTKSYTAALALSAVGQVCATAAGQTEAIFTTVPASSVGLHLEFANTDGSGDSTEFSMFGAVTHADIGELHTLVIVFEWRIGPGPEHDDTNWAQSPDMITTALGGITNPFSTGVFTTPGAWDTVAVHMYAGFPMTVSAEFTHRWVPTPGAGALLVLGGLAAARRRR